MADDMDALRKQRAEFLGLEPQALSDVWTSDGVEVAPVESEIEHSRSISAKRQADALEQIAIALQQMQR